jgi:hypothetical protein
METGFEFNSAPLWTSGESSWDLRRVRFRPEAGLVQTGGECGSDP